MKLVHMGSSRGNRKGRPGFRHSLQVSCQLVSKPCFADNHSLFTRGEDLKASL